MKLGLEHLRTDVEDTVVRRGGLCRAIVSWRYYFTRHWIRYRRMISNSYSTSFWPLTFNKYQHKVPRQSHGEILTCIRSGTTWSVCSRSSFQKRQMDGALCRVPSDFFEHVWSILERTPGGIKLCDVVLPQVNLVSMYLWTQQQMNCSFI